jgi:hypothetical protein
MMRRPFVSRATTLDLFSSMGTTLRVVSMDTAWLMLANKSYSANIRLGSPRTPEWVRLSDGRTAALAL